MTTLPSAHDVDAWRNLLWQAPDRGARAELVRAWAAALNAHEVTEPGHSMVLHLPHDVDHETAGTLSFYARTNGIPLRAPR